MSDFPNKHKKNLTSTWIDSVDGMTKEEIEESIVKCNQVISSTEQEKLDDDKLQACIELKKDLESAYNDVIKVQKSKIAYALHVMRNRGYY
jgi:hypothetical protein